MNGHKPEKLDPQILYTLEVFRKCREVALPAELPQVNLVDRDIF
jgi:hypothetical protein